VVGCDESARADILRANEFVQIEEPTDTDKANAISFEAWAKLSAFLNQEELRAIMCNIANGVGNHGDFLKAFATTYLLADWENRIVIDQAARNLIRKYNLFDPVYLKETV
jgi:hypothetical protein